MVIKVENYIEIDTNIINNNIKTIIKERSGYKNYIMVIKGNAYGHGFELVKYIDKKYINVFAVATFEEAIIARKYLENKYPILILQPIDLLNISKCDNNNFIITLSSYNYYKELIKINNLNNLKVHMKLNTGMNRLGIDNINEIIEIYNDLVINKKYNIILDGIYSHLASFGIVDNLWDKQVSKFKELTKLIDLNKINMIHLYSSSSLSIHPKLDFCNSVRIGELIYGINFNNFNKNGLINKLKNIKRNIIRCNLKLSQLNKNICINVSPAFKLVSYVSEIRKVKKGSNVGYDGEYITSNDEYIAVIPIGYSSGLSKNFTYSYVLINNVKYKIVSAINMCMLLIRTDNKVKLGDKVIIIGEELNIKVVSSLVNQSTLNILCSLEDNIKKVYIK